MTKKNNNQGGFTLIEAAIAITILGVVIAPLFALMTAEHNRRVQVEAENLEKTVLTALSVFLKTQGRYPCPARPSLVPGDNNFGAESCGAGGGVSVNAGVIIGGLPVHALNLPHRYAANTHNAKYIYAISQDLTVQGTFDPANASITVVDEDGNPFLSDMAHFVLVNPGSDMKGVYHLHSSSLANGCTVGSGMDVENCDNDATFREAEISLADNNSFYDDTIYYSLASEDNTFWIVSPNTSSAKGLNITNRNQGNIGIGTDKDNPPTEKLHIIGGNILIQDDGAGNEGKITAEKEIRAPRFYYDN